MVTVINPEVPQSIGTIVNPAVCGVRPSDEGVRLTMGDIIAGRNGENYVIRRKLDRVSGEADLYIAECQGVEYAVKLYRREDSIKEGIVQKLLNTAHPNLPRVYEAGSIGNNRYEIMEYYPQGSLEGTTLSEQELRMRFIPDMNEALRELGRLGIVHKDIKPSNIARKQDGHYVLMDFGISSERSANQSIIVTQGGLTPEYCAPEGLITGSWSELSDYYALGISIYQLYFGRLPYEGLSEEERLRSSQLNVLPIPDHISSNLKLLIRGLTYRDISNRKDKDNVNNRWSYEQVAAWLAGREQVEPGSGMARKSSKSGTMSPLEFGDEVYTDSDELFHALARQWEEGKKYIFRGYLHDYFKGQGMIRLASACKDVEEAGTDEAYLHFLYQNCHSLDKIYWKENAWSPQEFGLAILKKLWSCLDQYGEPEVANLKDEMEYIEIGLVSTYYESRHEEMLRQFAASAEKYIIQSERRKDMKCFFSVWYQLAYQLVGKALLYKDKHIFETYEDFVEDFERHLLSASDADILDNYIRRIVTGIEAERPVLDLQMANWMSALGMRI
jgi:serine/threonine protein kinase